MSNGVSAQRTGGGDREELGGWGASAASWPPRGAPIKLRLSRPWWEPREGRNFSVAGSPWGGRGGVMAGQQKATGPGRTGQRGGAEMRLEGWWEGDGGGKTGA